MIKALTLLLVLFLIIMAVTIILTLILGDDTKAYRKDPWYYDEYDPREIED